ncbi:zinc-ribbon domain-containing protein [Pollutibacter soli]|uniref:zinc-ribbon domain-containing protein n=1 Tax=Pollutibacter soli TaxID=3034157 RepID=UPI003013782B
MIVYGTRSKELSKEHLVDKCPNCGTHNSVDVYVFQKYAHVFWIPLFPMSKIGVSECSHCKQVVRSKEMSSTLKSNFEEIKSRVKTPIWTFSGLALIAIIITVGFISDKKKDERNAQWILTPQAGDFFEVRTDTRQYTLFKVDQVEGDSVFIRMSSYETNKISGLTDLKKKEFSEDVFGFAKSELQDMLGKGEIIDIERK